MIFFWKIVVSIQREYVVHRARSILLDDNDRYSLNLCQAKKKFYVVQLCESIRIETIEVGDCVYILLSAEPIFATVIYL